MNAGHGRQTPARVNEYVPKGQDCGATDPTEQYVPGGQLEQVSDPPELQVPASH